MSNDTFTFFCPACGAKLTLALRLAGVVGPCPTCRSQIQAPTMEALMLHAQATGIPLAPAAEPVPQAPAPVQPPPQPQAPANPQPRNPYFIEPRQLPQRTEPVEIVSRPISDQTDRPRVGAPGPPVRRRHAGPLRRALVPLVFLLASVALVAGLVMLLTTPPPTNKPGRNPGGETSPVREVFPTKPTKDPVKDPVPGSTDDNGGKAVPLVPLVSTEDRGNRAMRTLETFLTASSLAERLPHIETAIPQDQLEKSCLAGKLPQSRFETLLQESNDMEKVVDCYYSVRFTNEDNTDNMQTVLVRIRGDAAPKVVIDPFLDLYGGRLKEFLTSTDKDSGKFQVVLAPMRYEAFPVPQPENKLFVKLLGDSNDTTPIGWAVSGINGPIGKMLDDPSSGLRWGSAKCCTVVLQWNRNDPAKPYVEALNISRLDWNP